MTQTLFSRLTCAWLVAVIPAAQVANAQQPDVGRLLDAYGTIAGGWHLNQRCQHLDAELTKEFEDYTANTTIGLAERLGGLQPLLPIQRGAKKAADNPALSCGPETSAIVVRTLSLARRLSQDLWAGRAEPRPTAQYRLKATFIVTTSALAADKRCRHLSPPEAEALQRMHSRIERDIRKNFSDEQLSKFRGIAGAAPVSTQPCGDETKRAVTDAYRDAQVLTKN